MDLVVEGRAYVRGKLGHWAIGIEDGRIVEIARSIRGGERMNLGDLIILPGAIDPHVHLRDPGLTDKEDFATGTLAAACGGVTTILDMPNTLPPAVTAEKLAEKKEAIARKAWVDYGLFAGCMPGADIEAMAPMAVGFKVFMGSSTGRLLVTEDKDLARIAAQVNRTGKVLSVHAEDENLIQHDVESTPPDHLRNRPAAAEVSAIRRLSSLPGQINVCHVSSAEGLQALKDLPFTKEVTAHHMLLDRDSEGKAYAKVNPPLRTKEDRLALFQAFISGEIDMLASDHAPHTIEDKEMEFDAAPSGMPGVETTVPMMLALMKRGTVPVEVLVSAMAEKPASVFGLEKGRLEVGRDADLMVIDPRAASPIKVNNLHSKCGWTPFEGREAIFPHMVFVRGQLVVEDGDPVGERVGRDVVVAKRSRS
ncbi:MAG: dihydroorotase [Methanomassiliicoccaceae archaeon]|jgi:dihydroorotase